MLKIPVDFDTLRICYFIPLKYIDMIYKSFDCFTAQMFHMYVLLQQLLPVVARFDFFFDHVKFLLRFGQQRFSIFPK